MNHPYQTNANEFVNMCMIEFVPKCKFFSRTSSLKYCIQHVIGIHNKGYESYYNSIFNELNIPLPNVLDHWLVQKDTIYNRNKR